MCGVFFFSSRRRHTRCSRDWSSDVCSSDLILLPDGGLSLMTHGYAANLAHAVLLAIDNPTAAAGQIYNCGDEEQLSLRQVCEVICGELNHERPLGMERASHELEQVAVNPQAD